MTRLPTQTTDGMPTPQELMPAIVILRDSALSAAHFDFAVILSHTHAWLYWLNENWTELQEGNKK
jgi:hypothetical protein